jgi:hypothetical protein
MQSGALLVYVIATATVILRRVAVFDDPAPEVCHGNK